MEGRFHAFLASALDGGCQLHLPAALTSRNESCRSHWIRSWVGPTFDECAVESRHPLHVTRIEPCFLQIPARGLVTIQTELTFSPPPPPPFRVSEINSEIRLAQFQSVMKSPTGKGFSGPCCRTSTILHKNRVYFIFSPRFLPCSVCKRVGRVAQSVRRLTTDWRVRDRIPVGTRFSARPDWPWGPPSLL